MPARKSTSTTSTPSKTATKASSSKTPAKAQATSSSTKSPTKTPAKLSWSKKEVLADYRLARVSREVSLLGRKEVLNGRAKFGIFGDGKELPQIALSKVFENGDFRSGYYRDQTLLMAIGQLTPQQLFAQLYAHVDTAHEPHSSGRQMTAHFGTQLVDEEGEWLPQTSMKNSASDISCTAGQMARLLGLAQASSLYRAEEKLAKHTQFSKKGNEIAFGTIGDASTSEGVFWEALNAAGVLQVPIVMSVWDDGYGISVSKKYQTTKESISELLQGFQRTKSKPGLEILKTKAWDYEDLVATYQKAATLARKEHVPVVVHVEEVTQPQGHSTSGSHERYKSEDRLAWESEFCCNTQFRQWILKKKLATAKELDALDTEAVEEVKTAQKEAWKAFQEPLKAEKEAVLTHLDTLKAQVPEQASILEELSTTLKRKNPVIRKDSMVAARRALIAVKGDNSEATQALSSWIEAQSEANHDRYNSHWISETKHIHPQILPRMHLRSMGEWSCAITSRRYLIAILKWWSLERILANWGM
jgi:TPP-dependent pyruvate/acetoin dehydrogenase alpha subunit